MQSGTRECQPGELFSSARGQEVKVRMALGAGRGRLTRQLLTESAILALVGTGAGVLLAQWGTTVLTALEVPVPELAALTFDATVDWRVLLFAGGSAVVAVLTFGVVPVLQTIRGVAPSLRHQVSSLGGRRSSRVRATLISAQLALSVVLLTATGLLLQSWTNAVQTDLGFDPDPVLAVGVSPAASGYDAGRRRAFYQSLAQALPNLSGATAASAVEIVPLTMSSRTALLLKPGEAIPPLREIAQTAPGSNNVTPGYFGTLAIPLLAGRDFTLSDGPNAQVVAIVDEASGAGPTRVADRSDQGAAYRVVVGPAAWSVLSPRQRALSAQSAQHHSGRVDQNTAGGPESWLRE